MHGTAEAKTLSRRALEPAPVAPGAASAAGAGKKGEAAPAAVLGALFPALALEAVLLTAPRTLAVLDAQAAELRAALA
jgi:hypothetical protein